MPRYQNLDAIDFFHLILGKGAVVPIRQECWFSFLNLGNRWDPDEEISRKPSKIKLSDENVKRDVGKLLKHTHSLKNANTGNRFGCRNGCTATLKPDELVLHAEDHFQV